MNNQPEPIGLVRALEMEFAGPSERKRLAAQIDPRLTTFEMDTGKVLNLREHMLSDISESTTLIQEEVYREVLGGAQPFRCFREVLPIYPAKSTILEVPLAHDASNVEGTKFIRPLADGAAGVEKTEGYDIRQIDIYTYREIPTITQNLIDDQMFNAVADQIYFTGQKIENQINQECVTALLDNAGNQHDCGETNLGLHGIAYARRELMKDGYYPDVAIVCPEAEASLNLDTTFASSYGWGTEALQPRMAMGVKVIVCGVADRSSSYTWTYNSNGDAGMLVLDSRRAGAIAMRQDITVEPFRDPVRDLQSINVKARFGANYLYANATCRVIF